METVLNPQQYEAVTHAGGPQLVLAGAGSGKTRVITQRIAWLVREQGVDPSSIVAVTFTNKAAGEMRERVEALVGLLPFPGFVGTFHRFALVLLRRYGGRIGLQPGFAIFDRDDQISLVKKALDEEGLSESAFPPRSVLGSISSAKNKLLGPADYESAASGFYEQRIAGVYRNYQARLVSAGGVDFDDMLRHTVRLLEEDNEVGPRVTGRVRHLLVDEFQDTNLAQMRMVHLLIGSDGDLTAVGDEDQGIYRWRGADLSNVLEFERAFPGATIRKLEQNYRSTGNILEAAGRLVDNNRNRRPKRLWTEADTGAPIDLYKGSDDAEEARWTINLLEDLKSDHDRSEMAILVRTNAQTRAFEEELLRRNIPYSLVGGVRFYERAEIKDLLAYLRVLRNPNDDLSLLRILNTPPRGIGKATREQLLELAREVGGSIWGGLENLEPGRFSTRAASALLAFRALIEDLRRDAEELPLPALLDRLLEATGFEKMHDRDNEESQNRLENVRELLTAAQDFTEQTAWRGEEDLLTAFLDHVSLAGDIDSWEEGRGVSLMTLHTAKGLEFDVVVVAGLEDGVLPHFNAGASEEDLEEERRLLYVGMTRARKRLALTCCRRRRIAGRYQDQAESPFLAELPMEIIEASESPDLFRDRRTAGAYEFFDRPATATAATVSRAYHSEDDVGTLSRGRRVRHPTLGEGVVLDAEGSGDDGNVVVQFQRVGKRKLKRRYANLELI